MLETALELASYGFFVHPLKPNSKLPALKNFQNIASNDPEEVKRLFSAIDVNHCNFGAVMGKRSKMIGLDIDYDDGADPEFLKQLPISWTVKTGKGHHVYYRLPEHWPDFGLAVVIRGNKTDANGRKKPCVSIRSTGHQFALPPSIHPETGKHYAWTKYEGWDDRVHADTLSPSEVPLATAPDWLLEALQETAAEVKLPGQKYYENERHAMFVATATKMRKEGKGSQEIVDRLLFRNAHDCIPPKPLQEVEKEVANIAAWVIKTVVPDPALTNQSSSSPQNGLAKKEEPSTPLPGECIDLLSSAIQCLGFWDKDYFYTSISNKQLTRISATGHSSGALLSLMPLAFWWEMFPGKVKPNWDLAASTLMENCRSKGIFNAKRVRGAGCWRDGKHLVVHLGDSLIVDSKACDLLDFKSKNSYRLGPDYPAPSGGVATTDMCLSLIRACEAPLWQRKSSSILLAGHLALLRISGALPWRPHGWITGPAGCGKSTIMKHLVNTVGGEWSCIPQADTTAAGIRQELEVDSRPVLFDEIEAEDKRSGSRVKQVIELARQSSSDTEGRIFKGTPDGRGLEYKVNSMFIVASIGVSLTHEADLTRFCIYELERVPERTDSGAFLRQLEAVSSEFADGLFARAIKLYPVLLQNFALFQKLVADRSSQRHGQQYGMLLAGYAMLTHDGALSVEEANCLVDAIDLAERVEGTCEATTETSALSWLLSTRIRFQAKEGEAVGDEGILGLVKKAETFLDTNKRIQALGLRVDTKKGTLAIANQHPELSKIFSNTPWERNWKQHFSRIVGSKSAKVRFADSSPRNCVTIPLDTVRPNESEHENDDGIR